MHIINYSDLTPELARRGVFVRNMPNAAYHQYPGISNSGLSLVARSPAHYAYRSGFKSTRAMDIGTAFHTALLEPERYASEYMTIKGINDRRKYEYQQAKKIYGDHATLTDNEGASVDVMVESVRNNPDANAILSEPGHAELSAFAEDPETGVLLRCRYDWITDTQRVIDVKKTQDCRQRAFSRSVFAYRYYVQEAMYRHIFELIMGTQLDSYQFLAIEEHPPCANVLYTLDDMAKMKGHQEYREALLAYAEAEHKNEWPAYGLHSDICSLPDWVMMDMLDEELT
ncbi:PD-(D/E)XK nuclease-like domain-containing protein [Herbaspirillum sp.]|jgi:exodeoxyribonuclease VIII|uniref:PD-(D/E)XK nuclease-like domain-containing protein n=1 Tax=Herbaspirillum sp. TaxID=1890675 RepID=UPI000C0B2F43|nr:PD-(D/E)XK nuclease-like domain-containing protein [Herbaspirillum sp.]MAF06159.1 hypothetical protein [Herbaspirillum sp.]MAX51639.1 hypothetical protein [Methylophaga sp.]MAX53453.1 hypothetical protein [Methylophaga sp.]|tara:strand:- start:5144 stop:5998 length:855 start_codon:yes stop_codon:yes gene_type:complete